MYVYIYAPYIVWKSDYHVVVVVNRMEWNKIR
jgi:hypothetical protein